MSNRIRVIDLLRGTDITQILQQFNTISRINAEDIRQCQLTLRDDYFEDLKSNVQIWRNLAKFDDLPIIDKVFIRKHNHLLINNNYIGKKFIKKTGGSTGEPFVYISSAQAQSALWAGILLSWMSAGYRLGEKVAFLAGPSLIKKGWKQKIYYGIFNIELLSAFDMSPSRMESYIDILQRKDIKLLYGYASAVHRLAAHMLENRRSSYSTGLRGVVCTAEMMTDAMRLDIERAFGVPCLNQYGCNDAGITAFECQRKNGMHVLSLRSYYEILEDGALISTDLLNRALFMPRYNTGDVVRSSGRVCDCGLNLPLIDEVLGRQNDIIVDQRGNAVHSEFFTHLFRSIEGINSFQVLFNEKYLLINVGTSGVATFINIRPVLDAVKQRLSFEKYFIVYNQAFSYMDNNKKKFVMRENEIDFIESYNNLMKF